MTIRQKLDEILPQVQKPTRYIGNEYNSVHKNPAEVDIRFAFCFPDIYEVGMSHLGMKILYHLLNERADTYCERVFAPWVDMEEKMREAGLPLFSMETVSPLSDFDFVGFTLQYEMSYTNILNMLDLGNVPLLSADRTEDDPFVVMGGPCAYSAECLADFVDFFMLGEGEEQILEVMDVYAAWKKSGGTRADFLRQVVKVGGVYVPSFYNVTYHADGTVAAIEPIADWAPRTVRKRVIEDLDKVYYPDKVIVPFMEVVHDRVMLEVFRGCIRGCRFCQAGIIYRPVREKSKETLLDCAQKLLDNTGYEEISLSSLSTSDYTQLPEFTSQLVDMTEKEKVNLSLPSLRLDSFSMDLMQKVQKVRKSGLTFAPEAGTQRMRDVINKGITEADLMHAADMAFRGGYSTIKLYFMIGLPFETMEDVLGIGELAKKVVHVYDEVPKWERAPGLKVTASASSFVPKAFTPFQWAAQDSLESLRQKQRELKGSIHDKRIKFNYHEAPVSVLEGIFARGDRRLSKVLLRAHELGIRMDGWSEVFDMAAWEQAFADSGVDMAFYTRARAFDEVLPWDMIDVGVKKEFLISEAKKAERGETTPNCREQCSNCGAACFKGGVCYE